MNATARSATARSATVGTCSRDGLVQIVDTHWNHNGVLYVTVRELIGGFGGWVGGKDAALPKMRRLARRALEKPERTRSSRVVRTFYADGCDHVTFAVSRLD